MEHQGDSLRASYQCCSCNPRSLYQFAKSLIKQTSHWALTVARLRAVGKERAPVERGQRNQQRRRVDVYEPTWHKCRGKWTSVQLEASGFNHAHQPHAHGLSSQPSTSQTSRSVQMPSRVPQVQYRSPPYAATTKRARAQRSAPG